MTKRLWFAAFALVFALAWSAQADIKAKESTRQYQFSMSRM